MSALETYLKRAAETKGTWHKQTIAIIRTYITMSKEEDIINAITQITSQEYIRLLWEVGLNTKLQQIAIKRSQRLAEEAKGGI